MNLPMNVIIRHFAVRWLERSVLNILKEQPSSHPHPRGSWNLLSRKWAAPFLSSR